jgi:hypothetical protein
VLSGLPGGNPGQGGGAPGISSPTSSNSGPGGFGAFDKGNMSDMESDIRNSDRNNGRGDETSAATRVQQANSSRPLPASVLRGLNEMFPGTRAASKLSSGPFAGLKAGMMLWSNGSSVGIVRQIRTADDDSVSVVIVENAKGGFYGVPAEKLSLSGGALSTTMRVAGGNAPAANTSMGTSSH